MCSARCCVWRVRCVVGGCNFVTVECGMQAWLASLICTSCGVQDQCGVCVACWSGLRMLWAFVAAGHGR